MLSASIQNLILALVVIVPGFVATQVAISIGVVQTELSKSRILITSLTMSLIVVTMFLAGIGWANGRSISAPDEVGNIFFTPNFRPVLVLSLLVFSVIVGFVAGVLLAVDTPRRIRNFIWNKMPNDRKRNFYEPWEGTLNNAARVQVLTSDGAIAVGSLYMWSDDEKEQQLALTNAEWRSPSTDGWVDPDTDIELFTGDDIVRVTVVDTKKNSNSSKEVEEDSNNSNI